MNITIKPEQVYAGLIDLAINGSPKEREDLKQLVNHLQIILADTESPAINNHVGFDRMIANIGKQFDSIGIDILGEGRSNENNRMIYKQVLCLYLCQYINPLHVGKLLGRDRKTITYSVDHVKGLLEVNDPAALACVALFSDVLDSLDYPPLLNKKAPN
jgi:hypothetical protein